MKPKIKSDSISIEEYKSLSQKKPIRQLEGMVQKAFGACLNGVYKYRLSPNLLYWTYSGAGERKPIRTAVLQKRKGLQKGDYDYRFEILKKDNCGCGNYYQWTIYLEFKSQKGSLTVEQKVLFEKRKGIANIKCYFPKSVEEGIKILENEGVLV